MTPTEVFSKISSHMIKGIMLHEQMADYYDFLNLRGYKRAHEYHMFCEMRYLRKLHRYFINHFNMLVEDDPIDNPDIIPSSWLRYTRQDVDTNTKRSAVKSGIEKWVSWEQETKDLYEKMYIELMNIGEVAAAEQIGCFICEVDDELKHAHRKHICLITTDYSMEYIMMEQDHLHDKYKHKLERMYD